jgi:predicted DNA-binding transcriptional regulator AlpA
MMKNSIDQAPDDAIIRQPETSRLVGYCDMQLRRMEQDGDFPRRFKLNPSGGAFGAIGWSRTEIMAYIASRRASRQVA